MLEYLLAFNFIIVRSVPSYYQWAIAFCSANEFKCNNKKLQLTCASQYNQFQTLRVTCNSEAAVLSLKALIDIEKVDLMNEGIGRTIDILVSPENLSYAERVITDTGAIIEVLNEDVGEDIDKENNKSQKLLSSATSFFQGYHSVKDQHAFLDKLVKLHPDTAETFSIGKSYEKRDLQAIRISNNLSSSGNKPLIWVDGGIHAREWVAPATILYMAAALLEHVDSGLGFQDILDNYQLVLLPNSNPDGYEHSREENRYWRKTRRPSGCKRMNKKGRCRKGSPKCYGIDPNRNFDAAFNTAGVDSNPCSYIYPGKSPFSEKNTAAIRDYITIHLDKMALFMTYHAYSQLFLKPLGYKNANPSDIQIHDVAGDAYVKAVLDTHGSNYRNIKSYQLYPTSGGSSDWAYLQGIVNSYAVELRDTGKHGFVLPVNQIVPCGEENLRGLIALIRQLQY